VWKVASVAAMGVAVLSLISTSAARTHRPESLPSDSAKIAFASHRDGNWEIYVTDANGRNQKRLTTLGGHTRFPLWSPDGSRIAFATQRGDGDDGWDFSVMNADGTGSRRLLSALVSKSGREWSPDGRRIVLTAAVESSVDVYVADVATARLTRLTLSSAEDRDPSWSPDGAHITFSSERDGNREIYMMRADGGDVRRLTNHAAVDASPVWSPDGARILFVSGRDGTQDLYTMKRDGTGLERMTINAHSSRDVPRWSPDGSLVAFQIADRGRYDIGLLRLRDKRQSVLVSTPHNDGSYSWSPDGSRLAYISGPGGAEALHVVDVASGKTSRLTTSWSLTPHWAR
jgi:Tol biopolymer transport system component